MEAFQQQCYKLHLRDSPLEGFCVKVLPMLAFVSAFVAGTASASRVNIGTTLLSGEFATFQKGLQTSRGNLSRSQLIALAGWLGKHRSDWSGMLTEASSEPSSLQFELKSSGGEVESLAVIDRADGTHYLRLVGPNKWTYRSLGGFIKSWAATMPISDSELEEIKKSIDQTRA